jgi:hypothetical protein
MRVVALRNVAVYWTIGGTVVCCTGASELSLRCASDFVFVILYLVVNEIKESRY